MKSGQFAVEMRALAKIKPYPKNARRIPQSAIDKVAASLKAFGWQQPIVLDKKGVILAGHTRYLAAQQLGWTEAPVRIAAHLTEAEARAYRLADNRTHQESAWDDALLAEEMLALDALDFDVSLTGFDASEIERMRPPNQGLTDPDDCPEVEEGAITKPGDLWILGEHRLLCGDATKAEDARKLMGPRVADLSLTDPPYGVGEKYEGYTDSEENLRQLIIGFFPIVRAHAKRLMLTPGNKNQWFYPRPDWTLCWFVAAGTGQNPWGFSCWHPVLVYGKDPYLASGLGSRPDALALTEAADNSLDHPCPKPVKVWAWFMERGTTEARALVFDPFAGSGSGFIAAEMTGRVCFGLEIEPRYSDVIVRRWQAFTGKEAHLEGGPTFAEVQAERQPAEEMAVSR